MIKDGVIVTEVGARVIALACVEPAALTVDAYGAGVYAGDFLRPGYETVLVEGSEEYEFWADIIRRSDETGSSLQWSLHLYKDQFEQHKFDLEEYEQRCVKARENDQAERLRPMSNRVASIVQDAYMNPRIDLDEGGTVWGFECWWGSEDAVKVKYEGWNWVSRSIEDDRLRYDQT